MSLERLWAGWRSHYVTSAGGDEAEGCVLCRVLGADSNVVWRGRCCAAILNAFPYTSGHLMVMPTRHVGELEQVAGEEAVELWATVADAVRALKGAYAPDGINVGANLRRPAGAGLPDHFHVHVLPRWNGDTNFITAVVETRVLPESLPDTLAKLQHSWPG